MRCLHLDKSSFLEFREARLGSYMIIYFSCKHRWHRLVFLETFIDSAVPSYQEALQKSGYNYKLQNNPQPSKRKRSRSRNVIWFNPPYNYTDASHPIILYVKSIISNITTTSLYSRINQSHQRVKVSAGLSWADCNGL